MALWFLHQRAQCTQPQLCVCLSFIPFMLPITSIPGSYSRLQSFLIWTFFQVIVYSGISLVAEPIGYREERREKRRLDQEGSWKSPEREGEPDEDSVQCVVPQSAPSHPLSSTIQAPAPQL